ncbi:hypothetical protein HPB50_018097 [Hyalomma asiaticum]|uniref:Uncharacterized protein n=1 Tax=Hyalomma asiaticum TaxID=266040 RepID=A0ACB7RW02_HYAAI|nr:hypothetical protein HPB50_018097 [Hyalomma asiaticum]
MSGTEDKHAAASQQLNALTSSSPQGGQPGTSGKESEQATANQSTTALTTPLSPRGQRDSSIVPRDEDQRDIIDQPLPALTYSPLPHGGQPSADKTASGKKGEQDTAKQTVTALAAPFSPREARRESSTSMVPIEEDGRAMVEQGLPALSFSPLPHCGQPEATNMASSKESEQATAKQPMPAMTKPLSTCEGERESSTILGDKDQRTIVDHSLPALTFLRSPHDGQPDAIKMVSGEENEQATTNQPVTTMTTPLPPRERQRESSATPIHEDQPTIVDHQLPTVTFSLSAQDGQPRISEMANAKESEQVTANQPITALGASLPPCEGQQVSVLISSAEDQPPNLHQPLPALTSSLSPQDGRRDTVKAVSGKECELSTDSQSVTAPSLCLGPKESFMIPSDQKATVKASLPALAALLSREGQQQEAVKMAAANGCRDERTAIHIAPFIKQPSDATSPLSPPESRHEAAQTTTVAAATTAATATTGAPTSPLDHVLICGHGRFQKITLACTTLAFFTTIVHALASANLASPVDHWCK